MRDENATTPGTHFSFRSDAAVIGGLDAVAAGLMGAVAFGAGDIAGGTASRHINGFVAVGLAQIAAAATAVMLLIAAGGSLPAGPQFSYAVMAGAFHVTAVFYIYQGIARGCVCIIAPVAGVVGIAVPVLADLLFIETATSLQVFGILLASASIILVAQAAPASAAETVFGFSMRCALLSGTGFGFADLALGMMTTATAEGGLAVARMTGAALLIGLLILRWHFAAANTQAAGFTASPQAAPYDPAARTIDAGQRKAGMLLRDAIGLCLLAGVLDCVGQLGYVLSATRGQISIAAALVSIYPAISAGLAIWFFKERINVRQVFGIAVSLASIILLSQ